MIKVISKKLIYKDAWLEFYQDKIEFDDGTRGTYGRIDRKNGVKVVVVGHDNKILLNKEHRYIIDDFSWEVPGGGIDAGETTAEAAARELKEETGITATELVSLGGFYVLGSLSNEKVSFFLAHVDVDEVNQTHLEVGESIVDHKWVSFDEVLNMIDTGEISDTITAHAVQMAIRKLKLDS